jgi:signal transduction histidine kinase
MKYCNYKIKKAEPSSGNVYAPSSLMNRKGNFMDDFLLLEHVFNSITDIIGIQDLNHTILYYNQAGYEYFNKSPKEVIGCQCYSLTGRHSPCEDCAAALAIETGKPARTIRFSQEMQKYFDYRAYPVFDEQGKLYRIIEHIRDITQEKLTDAELKAAKVRAEESDELKDAFLNNISHEIRTPLNAIIGFSDLLAFESINNKKVAKYAEHIRSSGLGLMQMVNDIIDYSLLESGQLEARNEACNLKAVFEELSFSFRDEIHRQSKPIDIIFIPPGHDLPDAIMTDPARLLQILRNLLQNAVNFTNKGEIRFGYEQKSNNSITFFVEDTGIGIPKHEIPKIFDKFYTVNSPESYATKGSGIGLSLVKKLTELLGGTCTVESHPGQGTRAMVDLPAKPLDQPLIPAPAQETAGKLNYNWENKHILIAEDEELNYLFLKEAISVTRARVTWAKNGLEAVEYYRNHPSETDLVLMDLKMPEMDGFEATECIRDLDPTVPVVAQSAITVTSERRASQMNTEFADFLTKPIPPRLLLDTLNRHLGK